MEQEKTKRRNTLGSLLIIKCYVLGTSWDIIPIQITFQNKKEKQVDYSLILRY